MIFGDVIFNGPLNRNYQFNKTICFLLLCHTFMGPLAVVGRCSEVGLVVGFGVDVVNKWSLFVIYFTSLNPRFQDFLGRFHRSYFSQGGEPGVNFTNILRAAFLDESVLSSYSLLRA